MTEYRQWILEISDEQGQTRLGTFPNYRSAMEAMNSRAFKNGETLDSPDDSGNDEYVHDANILDDDGEWIYASHSYIIRGDGPLS